MRAKRGGIDPIPSAKVKNKYAYFQIVILAYNICCYYKILAQRTTQEVASEEYNLPEGIQDNTIRIARLKRLLIAAKLAFHKNRQQVKFSIHDSRTPSMQSLYRFIDNAKPRPRAWITIIVASSFFGHFSSATHLLHEKWQTAWNQNLHKQLSIQTLGINTFLAKRYHCLGNVFLQNIDG